METILKQHNQIELPQEVCRKLELIPGVRFDIEVEVNTGAIILQPVTQKMRQIRSGPENPSTQTEATR